MGLEALRREGTTLGRLAGPIVIAQLSQVGMGVTDTVMAGRLSALDLAAVALGSGLWLPVYLLFFGIINALSPTIAQLKGAGRDSRIGVMFRQGAWLAGVLAIAAVPATIYISVLMIWMDTVPEVAVVTTDYLFAVAWGMPAACLYLVPRFLTEAVGHTRPVMFVGLLGLCLNALANYALMFGNFGAPALGAVGCGLATTLVMWVDTAVLCIYVATRPRYRQYALFSHWSWPDTDLLWSLVRLGLPISATIMVEVSLFIAVSLLMSSISTVAMAAHQVAINYSSLMFMVPLSIGIAITIRVGHRIGAGDAHGARFTAQVGLGMVVAFALCSATVMLLFPADIVAFYTREPEVVVLAVALLFYAALFQLSDGLMIALVHALRGIKDTFMPMLIGLFAFWGIGFTSAYGLGFVLGYGPHGLWIGLIVGLTVAASLTGWRLHQQFRRLLKPRRPVPQSG